MQIGVHGCIEGHGQFAAALELVFEFEHHKTKHESQRAAQRGKELFLAGDFCHDLLHDNRLPHEFSRDAAQFRNCPRICQDLGVRVGVRKFAMDVEQRQ